MKRILLLPVICMCFTISNAQFLKKLKDKVNKSVDKTVNKAVGTDKAQTEIEKKETTASQYYSDVTENNEKPIFATTVPANGKMALKFKKGDMFYGGYTYLVSGPKKGETNPNILDYLNARIGSFYNPGEITANAVYINGKRITEDAGLLPLRPEFIAYFSKDSSHYLTSTEGKAGGQPDMSGLQNAMANRREATKEEQERFEKSMVSTLPTFTFHYNEKTFGPFTGTGEVMLRKSMDAANKTDAFWGLGRESYYDVKSQEFVNNAIIQTGNKLTRFKDYAIGGDVLQPMDPLTYPTGTMVLLHSATTYKFSNGKTIAIPKATAFAADAFPSIGNMPQIFGTDSGHLVVIPMEKSYMGSDQKPVVEPNKKAYIDYKTTLTYPVAVNKKQHLLVASNPSQSVYYHQHTLYYADGRTETINNSGDAQLVVFNGKDYIVWFEVMKAEDGYGVYICQKILQ